MSKEEMNKYAYELMVKNNPEEAVKNLLLKDKELSNLQEENIRLNNIINELEKYIKVRLEEWKDINSYTYMIDEVLDKLKELKEGK